MDQVEHGITCNTSDFIIYHDETECGGPRSDTGLRGRRWCTGSKSLELAIGDRGMSFVVVATCAASATHHVRVMCPNCTASAPGTPQPLEFAFHSFCISHIIPYPTQPHSTVTDISSTYESAREPETHSWSLCKCLWLGAKNLSLGSYKKK